MFITDFLCVNYVFKTSVLLSIMLMEYKQLTSHLTSVRFLTLIFGSRKETDSQTKQE